ncbi:DUF1861 family protein [Bacillus timonensis]|uniref:DUF1861 family protein n=1 Tax=Bacillus timonensis TaxID=1033734 RepID=A0A4S3PWK0_9BACI|nr:DUF1861 family protein [Bacillus timonensis]THE13944.1 DUF1861 family protein [Bacillus timonensis]
MVYPVNELVTDYKRRQEEVKTEKLYFTGVGEKDVYNITAPFDDDGQTVIAGRVEGRDTEFSEVVFFIEKNGVWEPRENTKMFSLQDPFVSKIKGELVFGGVEVFENPENEKQLFWRTVFYRGKNINSLTKFAVGPLGMKDIRLFEYKDGKIGIFTRPQGEKGGRGIIGYFSIASLDELNAEIIDAAPLVKAHFLNEEWGGVNEAYVNEKGQVLALGHIASFDEEGNRHYYPITFEYVPSINEIRSMKIIAMRSDFPDGDAKRDDLVDVLFSGGLKFIEDGKAELYVGVSDAEAHKAVIPNPFL